MYGKLFSAMYDGSLYGQWEAIVTFQQMIILADAEGYVDMTPPAMAARTSIPLDIITKGLELLASPDKYSRTPDCDGRRIELVDDGRPWGWRIVNHLKYRQMASAEEKREADRLRIAAKRLAEKKEESQRVAGCRGVSHEVADVAHADADADADTNTEAVKNPPTPLRGDCFENFWRTYPKKIGKAAARRTWSRKGLDQKADEIIQHLEARVRSDAQWLADDGKYIPNPQTWLNRGGWEDEYETVRRPRIAGI